MSAELASPMAILSDRDTEWHQQRLTSGAALTLKAAERHALRVGALEISPSHVLVAILERPGRHVRGFIEDQGASLIWLVDTSLAGIGRYPELRGPDLDTLVDAAFDEALAMKHDLADDLCLLRAILKQGDSLSDSILCEAGLITWSARSASARSALPADVTQLIANNTAFSARLGAIRQHVTPRRKPQWQRNLQALINAIDVSPLFMAMVALLFICAGLLAIGPSAAVIRPLTVGFIVLVWLVSLCMHEFGHAAAAFLLGDRQVKGRGYLTLDIRRYANPLLTFGLPLISLFVGSIPLPGGCVLIDHSHLDSPRARRLVSIAGPAANLLVLLVLAVPMWLGLDQWTPLGVAVAAAASAQASVLVLTMLPVPPLDGWAFFSAGSPVHIRAQAAALGFMPFIALIILFNASPEFDAIFWSFVDALSMVFNIDPDAASWGWWMLRLY
jgi:Zn-dependent protease